MFKRNRTPDFNDITELQKSIIICDYLKHEIEVWENSRIGDIDPLRMLQMQLEFEERKSKFLIGSWKAANS